jgi:chromate reductase
MEISVYSGLRELPPYDGSLDTPANRPAEAEELRRLIEEADGLLIVTPEYNCSVPGVLKNALDWVGAVLPGEAIPLEGKPIAITGASPSAFGSVRAQHALRLMLHSTNSSVVARPELAVHSCHQRFDAEGRLTDEGTEQLLAELLASLAENIEGRRAASELLSAAGTKH